MRLAVLALLAAVALAGVAGLAWRSLRPDSEPPAAGRDGIDLVLPAGPLPNDPGPWLRLAIRPTGGDDVAVGVGSVSRDGQPRAGSSGPFVVTFAPLTGDAAAAEVVVTGDDPGVVDGLWTRAPGWWSVRIVGDDGERAAARVLLPDPNVAGPAAVATGEAAPAARTLFQLALANQAALRSVRFWQTMADGAGVNAFSEHAVLADGDRAPSFTYRALGGMEAVVAGDRMWVRQPGRPWERRQAAPAVPPSRWAEEYDGATGFALGAAEVVGGERCRVVTFVVPERTESPRRAVAWYAWWVGEDSGALRREAMVSRNHYMLNEFADLNAPLVVAPPEGAGEASPSADPE